MAHAQHVLGNAVILGAEQVDGALGMLELGEWFAAHLDGYQLCRVGQSLCKVWSKPCQ